MKKMIFKSALLAIAGVGLIAGSANATSIDYNVAGGTEDVAISSSVAVSNVSQLGWSNIDVTLDSDLDDVMFSLDTGQSKTFDFLSISLDGNGLGSFDITTTLAFETPDITSSAAGGGWWMTTNTWGTYTAGQLTWADNTPESYILGGDVITIDFLDLSGCDNTQDFTVTATITNHGAAPVPEPATMLLFGTGLAGLAGISKRKKSKKS